MKGCTLQASYGKGPGVLCAVTLTDLCFPSCSGLCWAESWLVRRGVTSFLDSFQTCLP